MAPAKSPIGRMLEQIDSTVDYISTVRMGVVSKGLKQLLPPGFWGDHQATEQFRHPIPSDSRVYLTFDDGPSPYTTEALLELLDQENAKATFFLIGSECQKHPDLVKAIDDAGHAIGNHSWSHQFMPSLPSHQVASEIDRTQEVISDILDGYRPEIFRPPYGLMDHRAAAHLKKAGLKPVYWTAVPEDWQIQGADRIIRRVMMQLFPGSVIVLHEGEHLQKQTLPAVKELVYSCKELEFSLEKICLTSDHRKTTPSS